MNAAAFRHFYNYHFFMNRHIWNEYVVPLTAEQLTQKFKYSHGSVRDQVVHLMNVDEAWFTEVRGGQPQDSFGPGDTDDRPAIRAHWDTVEQMMRDYLANLQDDQLLTKPVPEGEDKDLALWQILIHVANHGTDHRSQLLRTLNDLGVDTMPQDYVYYAYEVPVK